LPRSSEGRWAWVRLWLKGRQKINFIREGLGSAADQPTWWEWLATPERPHVFAAVLGAPVFHSRSPAFHSHFFSQKQMPFWSIHIEEEEWDEAIPVLEKMGLIAAAVTAPLKKVAGGNTLWKEDGVWSAANTDLTGLGVLAAKIPVEALRSVAIWGGGGTLPTIQQVFPQAIFYAQRTGALRSSTQMPLPNYDVLVWAAGPEAEPPQFAIMPKYVLDLNYREDSKALEFALQTGAKYISGEKMFEIQAMAQQQLWETIKKGATL
jgi:shikimate 5-dehydrogenase